MILSQIDTNTAEPLVPEPSLIEVETTIENCKKDKSLGPDQIPAELTKSQDESLGSEIHKLICSVLNKDEIPQQWKESVIVLIHKNTLH